MDGGCYIINLDGLSYQVQASDLILLQTCPPPAERPARPTSPHPLQFDERSCLLHYRRSFGPSTTYVQSTNTDISVTYWIVCAHGRLAPYPYARTTKSKSSGVNTGDGRERSPKFTAKSGSSTLTGFNATSPTAPRLPLASTPQMWSSPPSSSIKTG